ncbi:MAG: hypothetical protein JWQ78_1726 [Sediminibacterium sp.]|nr:hypothetical protein [Sediminibacterium sp.]
MNPHNIQLPDFLIADLYRHSIVMVEEGPAVEKTTPKAGKPVTERQWYLGSNLQKITLIVNEKDAVYLQDAALQFLSNILGACKLNLGDVAIVNHHNDPHSYAYIKEKLSPRCVLLFGVTAKQVQLPFTVPHYQVQQHDNCHFLLAPPLENILDSKLEKSKLWLCLQKMFAI